MNRTRIHVVPEGGDWALKRDGADRSIGTFSSKDDAVEQGRKLAQNSEPSQLIVHKQDGTIETEYTYRDDPRDIPG